MWYKPPPTSQLLAGMRGRTKMLGNHGKDWYREQETGLETTAASGELLLKRGASDQRSGLEVTTASVDTLLTTTKSRSEVIRREETSQD